MLRPFRVQCRQRDGYRQLDPVSRRRRRRGVRRSGRARAERRAADGVLLPEHHARRMAPRVRGEVGGCAADCGRDVSHHQASRLEKELSMRPIICGLVVLLAACQATPPPLSDADKAGIRAVSDSFVAYIRTNRDSASASLFTEHAVVMPATRGIIEGRPAILAFFQAGPELRSFTLTNIDIDGRGDLAYVRGTYSFASPTADGQSAVGDHGKFIEIRRRQGDGKWLVAAEIFNSDQPVPARYAEKRRGAACCAPTSPPAVDQRFNSALKPN